MAPRPSFHKGGVPSFTPRGEPQPQLSSFGRFLNELVGLGSGAFNVGSQIRSLANQESKAQIMAAKPEVIDPYKVLGIEKGSAPEVIKKAHKKLALK